MKVKIIIVSTCLLLVGCGNSTKIKGMFDFFANDKTDTLATDTLMLSGIEDVIEIDKRHLLTLDQLYTDYDGGNQLADFFIIELIDEDTFQKNKALSINFLSTDTTGIRKANGVLRLPSAKGEIELTDNLISDEGHKEYTFIGQIKNLNAYLVYGVYWEDWNYLLIDQNKGSTMQTFTNIPHLSADQQYMISIDIDAEGGAAYIDLYSVTDKRYIDPLVGMYAKNWIPIGTLDRMYWCSDNYLYMPVVHNKDYWTAEGNFKKLQQYIRLKPTIAA